MVRYTFKDIITLVILLSSLYGLILIPSQVGQFVLASIIGVGGIMDTHRLYRRVARETHGGTMPAPPPSPKLCAEIDEGTGALVFVASDNSIHEVPAADALALAQWLNRPEVRAQFARHAALTTPRDE